MSNTSQYLFRVYHKALRYEFTRTIAGAPVARTRYDWSHTDHLTSLPPATVDLVAQASAYVFADSCLMLGVETLFVVCWKVTDGKPLDHTSEAVVFHPWHLKSTPTPPPSWGNTAGVSTVFDAPFSRNGLVAFEDITNQPGTAYGAAGKFDTLFPAALGDGFKSYDLRDPVNSTWPLDLTKPDAFHALTVARQAATGRCKLQVLKRCVAPEDVALDSTGRLTLPTTGTLFNIRFPLWRNAIETLPHAHSGWQLRDDLSIEPRAVALTKRFASCISDLMQQRRMLMRRSQCASVLVQEWERTVRILARWAWQNQEQGATQRLKYAFEFEESYQVFTTKITVKTQGHLGKTRVPFRPMLPVLETLRQFVNLAAIAGGETSLVLPPTLGNAATNEGDYNAICAQLGITSAADRVRVRGETQNIEVLRALVDIAASLHNRLRAYIRECHTKFPQGLGFTDTQFFVGNRQAYNALRANLAMHNRFARLWPQMQSDFLKALHLLFTWQATFDLLEPSRAATAADSIRRPKLAASRIKYLRDKRFWRAPLVKYPDLNAVYTDVRPLYVPFRVWGAREVQEQINREIEIDEEEKRRNSSSEETSRRGFAAAKRSATTKQWWTTQFEKAKLNYQRTEVPNPADPMDLRNWTDPEYRRIMLTRPSDQEFFEHATDIPDALDFLRRGALGAEVPRTSFYHEAPGKGGSEFLQPGGNRLSILSLSGIRRFVVRQGIAYLKAQVQDYAADEIEGRVRDAVGTENDYAPREIWPPGLLGL